MWFCLFISNLPLYIKVQYLGYFRVRVSLRNIMWVIFLKGNAALFSFFIIEINKVRIKEMWMQMLLFLPVLQTPGSIPVIQGKKPNSYCSCWKFRSSRAIMKEHKEQKRVEEGHAPRGRNEEGLRIHVNVEQELGDRWRHSPWKEEGHDATQERRGPLGTEPSPPPEPSHCCSEGPGNTHYFFVSLWHLPCDCSLEVTLVYVSWLCSKAGAVDWIVLLPQMKLLKPYPTMWWH